jgi:hypothetical protein
MTALSVGLEIRLGTQKRRKDRKSHKLFDSASYSSLLAIHLRGAAFRMTVLSGALRYSWVTQKRRKDRKSRKLFDSAPYSSLLAIHLRGAALRMAALNGTLRFSWVRRKDEKIEKVTSSSASPTSCASTTDRTVILSAAPLRWIASRELYSAESKDPGDAYKPMLLGAFQPPKPHIRSAAIRI